MWDMRHSINKHGVTKIRHNERVECSERIDAPVYTTVRWEAERLGGLHNPTEQIKMNPNNVT